MKPTNLNPQGYIGPDFPNPSPFWEKDDQPGGLPPGGTPGDVLTKTGTADGDADWKAPPAEIVGTVDNTAHTLPAGSKPSADVTMWQGNGKKFLSFDFGIPAGPAGKDGAPGADGAPGPGIGTVSAEAETVEMGSPAEVSLRTETNPQTGNKDITFHFDIPEGMEGPPGPGQNLEFVAANPNFHSRFNGNWFFMNCDLPVDFLFGTVNFVFHYTRDLANIIYGSCTVYLDRRLYTRGEETVPVATAAVACSIRQSSPSLFDGVAYAFPYFTYNRNSNVLQMVLNNQGIVASALADKVGLETMKNLADGFPDGYSCYYAREKEV